MKRKFVRSSGFREMIKEERITTWNTFKNFVNNLEDDQIFDRKYMFRQIYGINEGSKLVKREDKLDHYRRYLVICGILEHVKQGVYKKKLNIPINLTVTRLVKVAYGDKWKRWFIAPEDLYNQITK